MLQCSELLGVISIMFRTARCHLNIEIGDDPGAAIGGGRIAGLLVTDITRHNSVFMVAGDPRVAGAIEYPEMKRGVFELKGVVSRKKQLLPYVCGLVDKMSPAV